MSDFSESDAPPLSLGSSQFQTAVPSMPGKPPAELWSLVRGKARTNSVAGERPLDGSVLEDGLSMVTLLAEAPPRTTHSVAIKRSSPMSFSVRAMLEDRDFGRRFDVTSLDLGAISDRLPKLECPVGAVEFLADDSSFEDLSFSVDCLLQHRKQLLSYSIDSAKPRRDVLVLGAGPGGLMAAIELSLRNHRVVVCEQREVYTRNRFIGVYKQVAHLMASLGMPERMTYDFTHYRGKRGLMLADIQTFLHAVALKLGVVIYTGAVVREVNAQALRRGEFELQRYTRGAAAGADAAAAIGMTRWHYDTVSRVRSGVSIRFDTVLEATGGRSGLRELLVGPENVVSLRTVGRDAALRDPTLNSYFDDPTDHCAQFVESDYGCPPNIRAEFSNLLRADDAARIPDELPGLVSNVDASIILKPVEATQRSPGVGARIGDRELDIPRDWVLVRCPLPDRTLTRYQIEGPLPQSFEFGGKRVATKDYLGALNPVSLLVRLLYAMGVPFDAVDRQRLVEFYTQENSQGDASDIVAAFVGTFRGLRLGGKQPIWCGRVHGSEKLEYGIIGEALQNAWYRFGVGVDDTFAGAAQFAAGLELQGEAKQAHVQIFERVMMARSVQVLYHLYLVQQNTDQGVVGPVLTECYIDRRYRADQAEARLREEGRQAAGMLAALSDLQQGAAPGAKREESAGLLEAALEHRRDLCCRSVIGLLGSLDYDPKALEPARQVMRIGSSGWRTKVYELLKDGLAPAHSELLAVLAKHPMSNAVERSREERLVELGMGRYDWASPWVRACALSALGPDALSAHDVLLRATLESDRLVADTASAVLARRRADSVPPGTRPHPLIDKVILLKEVSIFSSIAHEELAGVANLLMEVRVARGEQIVTAGELGDCLYVIAAGRVRVHDQGRTLAELSKSQFFGELSLLDAEPRSASVVALEETRLLKLGQDDFYALMADRPQILHAINRGLCQMVRSMLRT
ncbi:MAG TPA: cyclic nucleotide-binding domain-containing protein [Polyangiaceae bacterium]|nr:cyclic nucleotide-binding domain-containing protein [Polyangiaceae bacterium]